MSSRTVTNLLLAALLLGLLALVRWQPGLETEPLPALVEDSAHLDIRRIQVQRQEKAPIIMEKVEDLWWLRSPIQAPVNEARIRSLLSILDTASLSSFPLSDFEPDTVGLLPPRLVLQLDDLKILFGDTESLDGRRYLQLGERVHLVQDRHYYQLDTPATGFVDHRLLEPGQEIRAYRSSTLRLERVDNHWQVLEGPADAGADQIQALLDRWYSAQALSVHPLQERSYQGEVVMATGSGEVRFAYLEEKDNLVLARPDRGIEYHLPLQLGSALLSLPTQPDPDPAEAAAARTE